MIARKCFLENIGILILIRMLPTPFQYLDPIIKKTQKTILRKTKILNETKTHRPNQKMDM